MLENWYIVKCRYNVVQFNMIFYAVQQWLRQNIRVFALKRHPMYNSQGCCIALCIDSMELNTLRPRQNGCHFADNIFRCIFLNENVWILIIISLKCVPNGPINITPALVMCGVAFIEPIHHNKPNTVLLTSSSFGSGNGLVPSRRQAMIWTNDG